MIKRLIKIFSFLLTLIVIIIFYLTFFGFNTEQFNEQIKTQVLKINKSLNLELKTVKILLSPRDLTVKIKTLEPKIFIDNKIASQGLLLKFAGKKSLTALQILQSSFVKLSDSDQDQAQEFVIWLNAKAKIEGYIATQQEIDAIDTENQKTA